MQWWGSPLVLSPALDPSCDCSPTAWPEMPSDMSPNALSAASASALTSGSSSVSAAQIAGCGHQWGSSGYIQEEEEVLCKWAKTLLTVTMPDKAYVIWRVQQPSRTSTTRHHAYRDLLCLATAMSGGTFACAKFCD